MYVGVWRYMCVYEGGVCAHWIMCSQKTERAPDPLKLDFQVIAVWFPTPKYPAKWGSAQSLTILPNLSTHVHTTIRTTAVNSWIGTIRRQREADFVSTCGISTPAWKDNQPLLARISTAFSPKRLIWGTQLDSHFPQTKQFLLEEILQKMSSVFLLTVENYQNKSEATGSRCRPMLPS